MLFRRLALKQRKDPVSNESKEMFTTLQPEPRHATQAKLLQALAGESDAPVRNKIGDAVAEIARLYTDDGMPLVKSYGQNITDLCLNGGKEQWPELLSVLFHASQSTDPSQRETAFRIFETTPGIIEKQHEGAVLDAFMKGFKDPEISVRLMRFTIEFTLTVSRSNLLQYLPSLPFSAQLLEKHSKSTIP